MAMNMLVIDDQKSIAFAVRDYFSCHGYEVDCATDQNAAAAFLVEKRYTVVIVDLCLSPTDNHEGLDLITLARQTSPGTRTILLTAYGSDEVEQDAYSRGVDMFLQKPQSLPELHRAIRSILEVEA